MSGIITGSFILLITYNLFALLNFIFQSIMARQLSISDYGILGALLMIIYFFGIFAESIQTVVMKYTVKEKDSGKIKNIIRRFFKKSFLISSLIFIFYLASAILLSFLLKIPYLLLALTGTMIFFSFFIPINRGILQGKKKYASLGINMISESVFKIISAVFFVYIGWNVYGAISGLIIGICFALLFSFFNLRKIIYSEEKSAKIENIYGYTRPTFFAIFAIMAFFVADVLIAKIVFPAEVAGAYAIASLLSKAIFWGTQPISRAMFPMVAENHKETNHTSSVFVKSSILLLAFILFSLLIFFIFPETIIKIFTGKLIPEASGILFYTGLAMALLSFANLFIFYKLSLGKLKNSVYLLIFVAIEVCLLFYFSENLLQFSIALLTSSAIFFWGSTLFIGK